MLEDRDKCQVEAEKEQWTLWRMYLWPYRRQSGAKERIKIKQGKILARRECIPDALSKLKFLTFI
jgi:hypothetical protein